MDVKPFDYEELARSNATGVSGIMHNCDPNEFADALHCVKPAPRMDLAGIFYGIPVATSVIVPKDEIWIMGLHGLPLKRYRLK